MGAELGPDRWSGCVIRSLGAHKHPDTHGAPEVGKAADHIGCDTKSMETQHD